MTLDPGSLTATTFARVVRTSTTRSSANCRATRTPASTAARCTAPPIPECCPRRFRRRSSSPTRARWPPSSGSAKRTSTRPLFADVFGGNALIEGMEPYAANYGGHQFGQWAGQLGDGRAITLAEVDQCRRPAVGAAAERRRPDAVLAAGRRPRRAAIVAPRIPLQRGDAPSRRADDEGAEPGADRRTGAARHVLRRQPAPRARRRRLPRRAVVHPLRQLPAARVARRAPAPQSVDRLHDPPGLSRAAERRGAGRSGGSRRMVRTGGRADRADGRRTGCVSASSTAS